MYDIMHSQVGIFGARKYICVGGLGFMRIYIDASISTNTYTFTPVKRLREEFQGTQKEA